MRASKAGPSAPEPQAESAPAPEGTGGEAATFTSAGAIPAVAAGPAGDPGAPPSASDLAYGGGGGGEALPDGVRTKFEGSLGTDLSGVRIHADGEAATTARRSGAKAVTVGQDIHFGDGQYDPSSPHGERLLAHELAHTVQQKDATPQPQPKAEVAPATHGAEADADQAAAAMVAGKPASVSPVAEQAPHAEGDGSSWNALMAALKASVARGDWADVAIRLNGLSTDDIAWYVKEKMTFGQVAHVREAAVIAMPGYSQRVTDEIDKLDGNAAKIAALYAAYEAAVKAQNWGEVANRLNGMGDWDIQDRLKKLDWAQLMAIRDATDNKRVIAAVDKADGLRARAVLDAYAAEVNGGRWASAAAHLNAMSDEDVHTRLQALKFMQLSALKPFASARIAPLVDAEIAGRPKAEHDPSSTKPTQVDGLVDVVAPLVALPDFSDDTRTTKEAHDAGGMWAGSAKLQAFVEALAAAFAEKKADQQLHDKPTLDRAATVEKIKAEELRKFHNQWWRVINEYWQVKGPTGQPVWPKFATVAKYWCSDIGQGKLFSLDKDVGSYQLDLSGLILPPEDVPAACEPMITGGSPPVRHIVNEFMRNLDTTPSRYFYNYPNHGGGKLMGQGFCVDVMMDASNAGRNDEGFTPREAALQMIHNIAKAAEVVNGDWQVCYNDYSVAMAAKAAGYGNRISHVGVNSKDDNGKQDMANLNGHGTHAPLNLHFHVDIVPRNAPPKTEDKGEKVPSPVGTKPASE